MPSGKTDKVERPPSEAHQKAQISLEDGARVGVIGGGPAGAFFAYFFLRFAQLMEWDVAVDIFEPRDFTAAGPGGCNMCGGIVSESLVQSLAIEGIELPETVVQRAIDSYMLHTNETSTRVDTPLHEKRIAALHRGGGPRDATERRWGGLDGHLLGLAEDIGARVIRARVSEAGWQDGRPSVTTKNGSETYDLLVGATGINSSGWELYEQLGFTATKPQTTQVFITELKLGLDAVSRWFGSSMHIFLLDIPRLDCAAMIPKGDYVTVCLLGDDINRELISEFFSSPAVRRVFPEDVRPAQGACHCSPRINVKEAARPFLNRVVLIGDCGATRLYKDGIGAAYRTAKAAARTAAFAGISARDFEKHYWPVYHDIAGDNRYGLLLFDIIHRIKGIRPFVRGVMRMAAGEQSSANRVQRMSTVLWDLFTGSAPYRDIFFHTLDPRFVGQYAWQTSRSVFRKPVPARRLLPGTAQGLSPGGKQ